MKVKVESEKVGFKLNIQKTKIMASGLLCPFTIIIHLLQMPDDIHIGLVVELDHDAFDMFSLICVIVFVSFSYAQ